MVETRGVGVGRGMCRWSIARFATKVGYFRHGRVRSAEPPGISNCDLSTVFWEGVLISRMSPSTSILDQLTDVIEQRRATMPAGSYTTQLFAGGVDKIGRKITEEAAEVVEAAAEVGEEGRVHLVREAADLLFHLMVMLAHRETQLSEVEAELGRRFGVSGLVEKAARSQSAPPGTGDSPTASEKPS